GSGEKYIHWSLATGAKLMEFRPLIRFSLVIVTHTGFTPMLKETLENLEMENLGIDSLDKSILILLNENSRMTYRALAKKLNEDVETIRYRFRRITKLDMIKRFTIVVERPPAKYNMAFFMDYALAPGIMERSKEAHQYYLDLDGRLPLINTFQYLASTSGSYIFFGMGCFENQEKAIQDAVIAHKKIYNNDNPVVHYAKITNMIKGLFPVRNIDVEKDFLPLKS
ncbi:MAG: AsnC family transcriptional regulator, partial [Candidatus Micrarchaeaceae archaeon]